MYIAGWLPSAPGGNGADMTEAERVANEVLAHSEDEGEWDERPAQIETRPSGTQVISARLPTALAEELLAEAERRGVKVSELVRDAVDHLLHPETPTAHHPTTGITASVSARLTVVTPLWQYRTENSNPIVEPDEIPEPPLVVALGYPSNM
jgi:hypothetical protein